MSDFTTLLKQSIVERGIANPRERATIYGEARSAMIRRLRSFEPPLGQAEIDVRLRSFDHAIREIEEDLVATFGAGEEDPPLPETETPSLHEGEDQVRIEAPQDDSPEDDAREGSRWTYAPAEAGQSYAATAEDREEDRDERYERYARSSEYDPADLHDQQTDEEPEEEPEEAYDPFPPLDAGEPKRQTLWARYMPGTERGQILALIAVIGLLVVVLAAIALGLLLPRDSTGATTEGVVVRREVSDPSAARRIPDEALEVAQSFVVFDGKDPTIFQGSSANPIRFDGDAEGGFAIVSSSSGASGAKALIGPGLATRLAGKRIRVTLVARAARENGANGLRFAYQSGLAISHWQSATLSDDYVPLGMIWRVPTLRTNPAGDFLLIEPGIPGDGTGAEIKSIKIDVLAS